jgi:hypothetical protein
MPSAMPAISSVVGPFVVSAARKPPIWTSVIPSASNSSTTP